MGRIAIRTGLLVVACAVATAAQAQAAKMYGVVVDDSGLGVADVKIVLEPVAGESGAKVQVVSKGKKGSYIFGLIRPGTYTLRIDSPGNALMSIRAQATVASPDQKSSEWSLSGRVDPEKPPRVHIVDAMDITCDLAIGKAVAIQTASGAIANVSADQAYTLLAQRVQNGDCAGALPQIDAFLAANPSNGRAFYLKGYCSAVLENTEEATAALEKAIELDPGFAGSRTLLGKVLIRRGKYEEAERVFRDELTNAATPVEVQVDVWLSLGSVLRDQKKTDDAIAAFQKVIEIAPNRPEPYIELSGLYADSGQIDKADAILVQAKVAGADDPAALLHVAISSFNAKDMVRAEALCRRVIEGGKAGNPDLASAYAILGRIQVNNGKIDDGVGSLKKSVDLDPSGRFAAQSEEILKALKKK